MAKSVVHLRAKRKRRAGYQTGHGVKAEAVSAFRAAARRMRGYAPASAIDSADLVCVTRDRRAGMGR